MALHGIEARTAIENKLEGATEVDKNDSVTELDELSRVQSQMKQEVLSEASESAKKLEEKGRKGAGLNLSKGDLVVVKIPPEKMTSKLQAVNEGPFTVHEIEGLNVMLRTSEGFILDDPVHCSWVHKLPVTKIMGSDIPQKQIVPRSVRGKQNLMAVRSALKLGSKDPVYPRDIIGLRCRVYWPQKDAKGWWWGKVVSYRSNGKAEVKYDVGSDDGTDTYQEMLFGRRAVRLDLDSLSYIQ
jgi:hypothetical protein